MTPIADGYYSVDRGSSGDMKALLRVSGGVAVFERASSRGWDTDPTLVGYWLEPGSDAVELVDRASAERLAARFGVELG